VPLFGVCYLSCSLQSSAELLLTPHVPTHVQCCQASAHNTGPHSPTCLHPQPACQGTHTSSTQVWSHLLRLQQSPAKRPSCPTFVRCSGPSSERTRCSVQESDQRNERCLESVLARWSVRCDGVRRTLRGWATVLEMRFTRRALPADPPPPITHAHTVYASFSKGPFTHQRPFLFD
jgi:hypothetical protein